MAEDIHIIPSQHIDRTKWDQCIATSGNALIYANACYLDFMADNWSGIVLNNYEAVMPVAWRKKMGIRYAYAVPFIQQLGWYGVNNINGALFIGALQSFIQYGDYPFNYSNVLSAKNIAGANNYIIDLSLPYKTIAANYKGNAINNIKKAGRSNLLYSHADTKKAVTYYQQLYKSKFKDTTEKDFANFNLLTQLLVEKQQAFARQVTDNATGDLLSIALFLKDQSRIYNIMPSITSDGRNRSSNHFLMDNFFNEFSGSGLLFDFEGSDIPGIESFYASFGAVNQPYSKLQKFNRLPFPLNILKR